MEILTMPRPERPIDPAAGPVQQFAAALRKLRAEAGNPPYRTMASAAHTSKASLSAAAAGHRLPTWEVTRAYVQVCGGDVEEWHQLWTTAREKAGYPIPTQQSEEPIAVKLASEVPSLALRLTAVLGRRRRPLLVGAGSVVLIIVMVGGALWYTSEPTATEATSPSPAASRPVSEAPARFVGGSELLADNADPKKSGCAADPAKVTTLDAVQVNTLDEHLLGIAQLRHAAECHASWGRFEPSDRLTYLPGPFTVKITAHRPATGTVGTPYMTEFDGQPVFGNILLDTAGCVEITVEVKSPHGDGTATTACHR
ncbi:helix-turn-helix domain-containing protein [Phytohabitans houttuyneae]|uniref:HTH cro/C1-type domain-containing protein n=1 Tax=Phytohabitans houttuyneae TaxID=1076126 RepID=A0A6V8K0R9_9ACTN|nr:helix-turn-helix domain-containing protein [Phytohabitans houttuyneae]GFJ77254.1 hypothetical protein Phou_014340 [Phytohabitans houttuyneae]